MVLESYSKSSQRTLPRNISLKFWLYVSISKYGYKCTEVSSIELRINNFLTCVTLWYYGTCLSQALGNPK